MKFKLLLFIILILPFNNLFSYNQDPLNGLKTPIPGLPHAIPPTTGTGYVIINKAPEIYRNALDKGDEAFNNNGLLDCLDEAIVAIRAFLDETEDKQTYSKFTNYIAEAGLLVDMRTLSRPSQCILPDNPELEVPQPITVNNIDDYMEKRENFTNRLKELDEQVQDLYKDIDKYNVKGEPLGIKINRMSSLRKMTLGNIPFLVLHGVLLGDPSDTAGAYYNSSFNDEVKVKKFFTRRNMIDLDTLRQALDYIIEGRQIMKRGIALDLETTRLRIMDNELDIAGNDLLTKMYVPEDGILSADEAIAGINQDFPASDIKMWADSAMNDFRLEGSDSVYCIRELNDRLLALFEKRKMLNEKIREYNDQVDDFNDEVADYNKDKNELLQEILKNNQGISEMQAYADSLIKNRDKSFDSKRKAWQFYRDLNYTKKDAWKYYQKSIESDQHGIQLLKKKNEIDSQKDQLSREQEKLNKLEEMYKKFQKELLMDIQQ